MADTTIYHSMQQAKSTGQKTFAVLIDPDGMNEHQVGRVVDLGVKAGVDYFFVGGSLILDNRMDATLRCIQELCQIPTILFPGDAFQIHEQADAILFLSLISGRNPELLIGKHVIAAPYLQKSSLEILPTGYMLVDGGRATTASYMSHSFPIPADKDEIAVSTALAGEMLGLRLLFLDAGSGAKIPVRTSMIQSVSKATTVPLIVGGGICSPEKALQNARAGADVVVVGNAVEKDPALLLEMAEAVHSQSSKIKPTSSG